MTTIWSILLAILIFGCIIAIHEFGHFIAAKRNGIQVNEFAIGMGPKIFRFQKGETLYSLRLFPVGGFCSMEGEDAESKNARAFDQKPVWRRMIVVLAGAFMNLVLGFVLLIATTCSDPYLISNTIHGFHKQATSNTCGLQAGDTIVSLNGSHIFTITDLQYKLSNESGEPFTVVVERDGKKVKLQDVTFRDQENNDWLDFSLEPQQKTVFHVLSYAAKDTVATGKLIWMSLTELVTGKYGIQDLSGPVGTVEVISNAATAGATAAERISSVLHLTIFITINVGIFNLLPIPGLDGSRFWFLFLEAIRRKPVKKEHEALVHLVGMAALFLLMIVVTVQDVTHAKKSSTSGQLCIGWQAHLYSIHAEYPFRRHCWQCCTGKSIGAGRL